MKVFVQHMGTPATKAHDVGVLTLEQCIQRFVGMNERGWSRLDSEWVTRLCREGGRYAHFYFSPCECAPEEEWVLMNTRDDGVTLWRSNGHWWAVCPEGLEPQHADSFICPRARAEQEYGE